MSFNCGSYGALFKFLERNCGSSFYGEPKFAKTVKCLAGVKIGKVLVTEQMAQALHDLVEQGGGIDREPVIEPEVTPLVDEHEHAHKRDKKK